MITLGRIGFDCSKCGECCKHIASILPEFDLGNGTCCHLTEDGLCDIYNERPLVCSVDRFFEKCLKGRVRREDWYDLNHKSCDALKETNTRPLC